MNQVVITAKHTNFDACVQLALQYGLGIEVQTFAFPPVLAKQDWSPLIQHYRAALAQLSGPISLHGAFMDMAPGSPDPLFIKTTHTRTVQSMELAAELGADSVVFHANFIASIRTDAYRDGWIERMIDFFGDVAALAEEANIQVLLENMWEFDPSLISHVLAAVNSPYLNACLDVGHAHLFSKLPFRDWLEDLEQWVTYIHMNNNYGEIDEHHALDDGVLDYNKLLPLLQQLPQKPRFVLEIDEVAEMERSLVYFPHYGRQLP